MTFVYPIKNTLPSSNPHGLLSFLPWKWIYSDWDRPVQNVLSYISEKVIDSTGHIPVGTKLYHGSLVDNLDFSQLKKDRITFFGIDVVISLWYILELQPNYRRFRPGTLYEFTVTKPIQVRLMSNLTDNPKDDKVCAETMTACIHPQMVFHGETSADPPYDLGVELTLNMKYYKDYIKLKKTYTVDPEILYKNVDKPFELFNPVEAIVKKERKEQKEKETPKFRPKRSLKKKSKGKK